MNVLYVKPQVEEISCEVISHQIYYTQAESFYQLLPKRSYTTLDIRNPFFRREFEKRYNWNQKTRFWCSWYLSFAFSKSQKFGLQCGPIFLWIFKLMILSFILGTSSVLFEPVFTFLRSKRLFWTTTLGLKHQPPLEAVVLPKATLPVNDGWIVWSLKMVVPQLLLRGTVFVFAPVASSVLPVVFSVFGPVSSFLLDGVTTTLSPFSFVTTPVLSLVSWGLSTPQGCSVLLRGGKALVIGGLTYVLPFSQLDSVSKLLVGFFDVVILLGRSPGEQLAAQNAQVLAAETARTLFHDRAREQATALQQQALNVLIRNMP